jgi:uncharacterized cupin superfamily protein
MAQKRHGCPDVSDKENGPMPTVNDVVVRKPSDEEADRCKSWPIWSCDPSTFDWSYTEKETCLILEGKVTVSDDEGSVSFGPGDLVEFPQDLDCVWNVREAVKKHYTFG